MKPKASGASRLDHYFSLILQLIQPQPNTSPKFAKQDAVPVLTHWSCNVFILSHALWPGLVRFAYSRFYDGASLPFSATLLLFAGAHLYMMAREGTVLINLGSKVGFLDGDQHARDPVTPSNFPKTLFTVTFFSVLRPLLLIFVAGHFDDWDFTTIGPWLPLELLLYGIILDFWFYAYHRACHEIGPLWKYHKTHHTTKHPIPVLSSFSDIEQELIEVFAVPLASYLTMKFGLGLPMTFYDWWICQAFILFAEIMGHSGLRVYAVTPGLASFVLGFVGCELVIEDHDLHHRQGYRKSGNYGKQTKLWDTLFGTVMPRVESENVDYDHGVHMPFF